MVHDGVPHGSSLKLLVCPYILQSYTVCSGGSSPGPGGHAPPVGGLAIFFRQYINIIRPRRSRSGAAYSHQTFPCTICRSVCLSVGLSVCLSVQCIVEKRQIAAGSRSAPYVGRVHG